ncbi:MAG TPA: hypothetical protein VI413_11015 [Paludibacter sp.]
MKRRKWPVSKSEWFTFEVAKPQKASDEYRSRGGFAVRNVSAKTQSLAESETIPIAGSPEGRNDNAQNFIGMHLHWKQ